MTGHPRSLSVRPEHASDLLSELLRSVRFTGALYYRISTSSPWPAIRVPDGSELVSAFGGRTRTVVSFHVVVEGSCWTGIEGQPAIRLQAGDVVVYPKGDAYFMTCRRGELPPPPDSAPLIRLLQDVSAATVAPWLTFGSELDRTTFVCGFLGCDPRPFDPLLGVLPSLLMVRRTEQRLAPLIDLALTGADDSPGSRSVRERLSESMFLEAIRLHLSSAEDLDWLGGSPDQLVGRAMTMLQHELSRPWSLDLLAREVGVSRSVLAQRFTTTVGEPPMHYLARRRIQSAAGLLTETTATVAAIAQSVGYGSEAAFSHAFKRSFGMSPSAWRHGTLGQAAQPVPRRSRIQR
jgi:AraC-like DNA-binding protein